jgi:molybdopterin converting factor small subunit
MTRQLKERIIEVERDEVEKALEEVRASLGERRYEVLRNLVDAYDYVTDLLKDKETSIKKLRKILFGSQTETTENVLGGVSGEEKEAAETPQGAEDSVGGGEGSEEESGEGAEEKKETGEKKKRKGHGRAGAGEYTGAEKIAVPHPTLRHGDPCPETGCKGKVYRLAKPGVIVRIRGRVPLGATVYELERLRCNLCLVVFIAPAPEGVGEKKYDPTAGAMIALLRYGSGLPFNRVEKLERNAGIPLPAATQWEVSEAAAREVEPVWRELIDVAAQGEIIHNDDTSMTVLSLSGDEEARKKALEDSQDERSRARERTGVFTSGIISKVGENLVALYFTGRKHAGENLAEVLSRRARELPPPIHMCDGLSLNVPEGFEGEQSNCLTHGRRHFVDVVESFPEEVRYVLELLKVVYRNDAAARERGMSKEERLEFHKEKSGPVMEALEKWLEAQIEERRVEPNSGLGKAIAYMQKRWEKLTLFLRVPGAPLDNTIVERALKRAILHRKNSLFYKTENGARVGDIFMSLIQTAELSGVDPFDYLVELLRHPREIEEAPKEWLPWNYKVTLERLTEEAAQRAKG